ncbi:RiPP maturation radical SAM C-methyltransferase [Thalassotalea sp. 1_MG-2023]|uniref:RiPP maturation radical SAM C-methyltransferase n=1 Tax=Thalassotalea sp. 1_MG-2023 TaxID=3062680 RepID=UPI0026E40D24|nr:RiPP maturation radical SAM C-methyltransferase [Thalassotalea sp. 1_MG-2023]MDO6428266.1 RiPP maturation radical SAM C-methyltransferase [Thalassotalea sp. 1_MG-2023]
MDKDIYLVCMPYTSLTIPSMAMGVLETYITEFGYNVESLYANLVFAKQIGLIEYNFIDNTFNDYLIGEWTFSKAAFPDKPADDDGFFALFTDLSDENKQKLLTIRETAERYIDALAHDIVSNSPKIVGCTSTFQQNCASIALLRKIKSLDSSIITLMGGANCEGIMGQTINESFSWIDYVFSGECDDVIGPFIDKLMKNEPINYQNLPNGFISQKHKSLAVDAGQAQKPPRAYISDMRKVGEPIFDSYFQSLESLKIGQYISPGLVAETSRGCWWGAKQHCTFCGLNGGTMDHRSKSPEAALSEFKNLSSKYKVDKFLVVDNILPIEYMKTVLPTLAENPAYNLFYETKANLKQHHVKALAEAGIKWIQPGIEGLHDDFLKAIKKGTTAIQNLAALKWCRSYGVRVTWNLLCEAPGEQASWYDEMAEWLPLVTHYHPPFDQMAKICYHRFSPYFNTPEKFGLTLEPTKSYQYIYPLDKQTVYNLAYFFIQASEKETGIYTLNFTFKPATKAHAKVQSLLDNWSESWLNGTIPMCCMTDHGDNIIIFDTRKIATSFTHSLEGLTADIYRLCAEPLPKERLIKKLNDQQISKNIQQIEESLHWLTENHLIIHLSKCLMALAFPLAQADMPSNEDSPGGNLNIEKIVNERISSNV